MPLLSTIDNLNIGLIRVQFYIVSEAQVVKDSHADKQ